MNSAYTAIPCHKIMVPLATEIILVIALTVRNWRSHCWPFNYLEVDVIIIDHEIFDEGTFQNSLWFI